tara:strand:- start:1601 stop:2779 length:1179 start_codon:yes stop_codon:yes gene_type:complete
MNGDAFLMKTNLSNPTAILIDGGYPSTFNDYIQPDLRTLAVQGYCLDLVVATHIDADHISGLLAFFKKNGNSNEPRIIPVKEVWHNSVRSLGPVTDITIKPDDAALLTEIKRRGYPQPTGSEVDPKEISARQGSSLAALLLGGNYRWNMGDGTTSINSENLSGFKIGTDTQLDVISPQPNRLEQLRVWWGKELRRLGFTGTLGANGVFDDAFEFLCAFKGLREATTTVPTQISSSKHGSLNTIYQPDTSVTNSSSIAFIANVGSSRVLFLGDAWAEDIELHLRMLENTDATMIFDAIKVSHHGSFHNTSHSLLELIDAPVYFISTDGKRHDHPDIAVLKAIVDRPCSFHRNLYFSHTTSASREMRNYRSTSGACFSIYEDATDWIDLKPETL